MAPKKRTTNKHLPPRVYIKCGSYYFVDTSNKWHKLGKTLTEAMTAWGEMLSAPEQLHTMNQIFDRYMLEVAPLKAAATYRNNQGEIQRLRAVFGDNAPSSIQPVHIYKYLDMRGKEAPIAANREKSLLSHVFSSAIRWGVINSNPCKEVSRLKETPRDRYITDKEFLAVREIATPLIGAIMDFAYLTALRQMDILKTKLSDLNDDGVSVHLSKTRKKILIEWTDELKKVVTRARSLKRTIKGMYLFCNEKGQPYTPDGFRTLWHRTMQKALSEQKIAESFQFRDIRRKAATDAERLGGREYARQLLGHTTQNMTANYISGEQKVRALK